MAETCKHCILIAEDDPSIRHLLVHWLGRQGYQACEAANGDEALLSMKSGEMDLVVLDLMMPGTSGWDVLAERAKDDSLRKIPVIVISANRGEEVARVLDSGICALLPKPFDLEALGALVKTCIQHRHETALAPRVG